MTSWRYFAALALVCVTACRHEDTRGSATSTGSGNEPPAAPAALAPAAKPAPAKPSSGSAAGSAADDGWGASAPTRDPLKRVMMWSAVKNGKTLYFLGTMHLGVDAEARLPDVTWKDFDAAPAFAMETDLTSPAAQKMQTDARRTSGTLHDELGAAYWKKLEDALTPAVAHQFDGMKPFVPAVMLSMQGLPQTPPMDSILRARAEREHKQLVFLEDAAADAVFLERWMDRKALVELLDTLGSSRQRQQDMLAAYIAGDDAKLLSLNGDERKDGLAHGYTDQEMDALENDLLYSRNASWIPGLEKMANDGGGFVAVGALHLIGPRSVLDLLGKDGFVVTRIEP
jgi:uncharacterized protein YbaP (TraB family)